MTALFTISVSGEAAKKMEILRAKKISMFNLFTSYMNDRFEIFDDFKLNAFIDEYSLTCLEYSSLINNELAQHITSDELSVITAPCNKYCINFNYTRKEISVMDKQFCQSQQEVLQL